MLISTNRAPAELSVENGAFETASLPANYWPPLQAMGMQQQQGSAPTVPARREQNQLQQRRDTEVDDLRQRQQMMMQIQM